MLYELGTLLKNDITLSVQGNLFQVCISLVSFVIYDLLMIDIFFQGILTLF